MLNKVLFPNQTSGSTGKCIDRVYIKVINHRMRSKGQNDYELTLILCASELFMYTYFLLTLLGNPMIYNVS